MLFDSKSPKENTGFGTRVMVSDLEKENITASSG